MLRRILAALAAAVLIGCVSLALSVQDLVDEVSFASYRHYLDDVLYTHSGDNRGLNGPQHDPAQNNIFNLLTSFGLDTTLHPFLYSGNTYYNVVAVHRGRRFPERIHIVGAHYDSVNNPGADDNASGVAGVLEIARILSRYTFEDTLVFIAFDREEQGLWGSKAYANDHAGDDIRGMISLDMIAYDGSAPGRARTYGRTASNPIKQALAGAIAVYGNGVTAQLYGQLDASDHAPFEWKGFQACLLIESGYSSNPHYHKATDSVDTPNYINYQFATNLTRGTLGYLATAAGLIGRTATLREVESSLLSPTGEYRWRDVADQLYRESYRTSYQYSQARVVVDYSDCGPVFAGTLTATNLKPNFAYQLRLVGIPDTTANENIGLTGRWWQEEWSGTEWTGGTSLDDKGDGSSPNPNDLVYFARRDLPDPDSPTGKHYRFTGYRILDYFITDENGNASLSFTTDSTYHVLWKTSQRERTADDGPLKSVTFDPDPAVHPAYDTDYGEVTVGIFGEWERLPTGGIYLPAGRYHCQILLTEESFHGSGGTYAGCYAAAVGADVTFAICHETVTLHLDEGWNLVSIPLEPINPAISVVFPPGVADAAWEYDPAQGYVAPATVRPRKGYWVKASAPGDVLVRGIRPAEKGVTLGTGWNLVGVIGPSAVQPWQPLPASPHCEALWEYLPPYRVPRSRCDEGRGFWIRASAPTTIWSSP